MLLSTFPKRLGVLFWTAVAVASLILLGAGLAVWRYYAVPKPVPEIVFVRHPDGKLWMEWDCPQLDGAVRRCTEELDSRTEEPWP